MKETTIIFDPIKMDFIKAFTGTAEEQKEIEEKEKATEKKIHDIIKNPAFIALEYNTKHQKVILTKSIRNNIDYQLSFFDLADGLPTMHENYNITPPTAPAGEATHKFKELSNKIASNCIYNKKDIHPIIVISD